MQHNNPHKNIPALRFPEFEGEWEEKKINSIGKFLGGGTPESSNKNYWNGEIPWISSSDISDDSIFIINKTRFISENAIKNSATKKIPKNSVLMVSRVGVGKFAVADEDLCTSQDFTNLICNENAFFTALYFKARSRRFVRLSQGTSILGFTTKDIKDASFSFPTLPEQQKIADFLTVVDKKLRLLNDKKEKLEQYKKGLMQKIFSQEIRFQPHSNPQEETPQLAQAAEPATPYGNNHYPDWEVKKLGEIATITTGSSNREDSSLIGEFTFFDRSQDIRTSDRYLFDKEAIIFPGEGQKFVPKYFIGKFDLHQRAYAIFDFKNVIGLYLFYFLGFSDKHLQSQAVGSTVKSLRLPMFKSMPVDLPCLEEQQKIAGFLSALDAKITTIQTQIEQHTTWKKGLLQKMFV